MQNRLAVKENGVEQIGKPFIGLLELLQDNICFHGILLTLSLNRASAYRKQKSDIFIVSVF